MDDILGMEDVPSDIADQFGEEFPLIVDGLNADARRAAPCLITTSSGGPTDDQLASARLLLFSVLKRWSQDGVTARSVTVGPFQEGAANPVATAGYKLWPTEIERLQKICRSPDEGGAFALDTVPTVSTRHDIACSSLRYVDSRGNLIYGGAYCDCGADIAGIPLRETF